MPFHCTCLSRSLCKRKRRPSCTSLGCTKCKWLPRYPSIAYSVCRGVKKKGVKKMGRTAGWREAIYHSPKNPFDSPCLTFSAISRCRPTVLPSVAIGTCSRGRIGVSSACTRSAKRASVAAVGSCIALKACLHPHCRRVLASRAVCAFCTGKT